jgi:hypothetical protein
MKNGTPRQAPDLRTALEQPLDHKQERCLSRRIKILDQRLLMLKRDDLTLGSSQNRGRSAARKLSRQLVELGLTAKK